MAWLFLKDRKKGYVAVERRNRLFPITINLDDIHKSKTRFRLKV